MATTIKLKNSVTTTNAPSSLVQGEVAINITDKKVWVGNAATTPIQLLGDGGSASFTSIAFGAGTVSSPSITFTGDTNTGIYSPAADTIAFTEGGVEAMRIDSSGNVGIGTSSPDQRLDVRGSGGISVKVQSSNSSAQLILNSSGTNVSYINYGQTGANPLAFYDSNASAERMRITSAGDVGIGLTSPTGKLGIYGANISDVPLVITHAWGSSTTALISASNSSGVQFSAQRDGVITVGSGVKFPATQSASSDANTLDDYEEGTFTPTIIGSTSAGTASYTIQVGKYTKIGNRVYINCRVEWSSGTGTGSLRITGLPFSVSSATDDFGVMATYAQNITLSANNYCVALAIYNSTRIDINQNVVGGGADTNVNYDASGGLVLSGFYNV